MCFVVMCFLLFSLHCFLVIIQEHLDRLVSVGSACSETETMQISEICFYMPGNTNNNNTTTTSNVP